MRLSALLLTTMLATAPLSVYAQDNVVGDMSQGLDMLQASVVNVLKMQRIDVDPNSLTLNQVAAIRFIMEDDEGSKRQKILAVIRR